jgi:hypothetical protein
LKISFSIYLISIIGSSAGSIPNAITHSTTHESIGCTLESLDLFH